MTLDCMPGVDVLHDRLAEAQAAVGTLSMAAARTRDPQERRRLRQELDRAARILARIKKQIEQAAGMAPAATSKGNDKAG